MSCMPYAYQWNQKSREIFYNKIILPLFWRNNTTSFFFIRLIPVISSKLLVLAYNSATVAADTCYEPNNADAILCAAVAFAQGGTSYFRKHISRAISLVFCVVFLRRSFCRLRQQFRSITTTSRLRFNNWQSTHHYISICLQYANHTDIANSYNHKANNSATYAEQLLINAASNKNRTRLVIRFLYLPAGGDQTGATTTSTTTDVEFTQSATTTTSISSHLSVTSIEPRSVWIRFSTITICQLLWNVELVAFIATARFAVSFVRCLQY